MRFSGLGRSCSGSFSAEIKIIHCYTLKTVKHGGKDLRSVQSVLPKLPVTAVRTSLSIWYLSLWSSGRIFSKTLKQDEKKAFRSFKNKKNRFFISSLSLPSSHRSYSDQSTYGFTVFYFASFCFDADQVSEVLEIEDQQVIPKVQKRQTLQREKTESESGRTVHLDQSC